MNTTARAQQSQEMICFTWNYHQLYCSGHYVTVNYVITLQQLSILSFICRYNNYQYRRFLIVMIKGYDFKEATLASFHSTDGIYQAGEDVVGRETPTTKPTS